jgi:hypothetical protein
MKRILWATAWVLPFLMVTSLGARVTLSKLDSDRFQTKMTRIKGNGQAKQRVALRTAMSEAEVNSYLAYALAPDLPAGITDPYVTIEGDGRVSGQAIIDLNQVRAEHASGGWVDPLAYLTGKVPVIAIGSLHTSQGTARVELESTTVSGVPVPTFLLQALVSHYTRTPENPNGISLDDTFKLPANIREIEVGKGEAVIVQ